ncbi:hypothetical protein RvY_18412 [Ramazzottius varieornatus]|uniref:Uncharacterized protein n=1 Tax=Ramazzottius varieornatus TaxID=947166 RepID=A0A1D1W5M7_RAMVA|nr:hypothetical protein RvY_18412 [Ramazzottius varieornatus]
MLRTTLPTEFRQNLPRSAQLVVSLFSRLSHSDPQPSFAFLLLILIQTFRLNLPTFIESVNISEVNATARHDDATWSCGWLLEEASRRRPNKRTKGKSAKDRLREERAKFSSGGWQKMSARITRLNHELCFFPFLPAFHQTTITCLFTGLERAWTSHSPTFPTARSSSKSVGLLC